MEINTINKTDKFAMPNYNKCYKHVEIVIFSVVLAELYSPISQGELFCEAILSLEIYNTLL